MWKDILFTWAGKIINVKFSIQAQTIEYNPYQNIHDIFLRTRTSNPKIYMEPQKIPSCQSNLDKKEQSWGYHTPWLQTILKIYSNQNSMVLAQKQTHRLIQQNRELRNKSMHLWSINLPQRRQEYIMKKIYFSLFNEWYWENCKDTY